MMKYWRVIVVFLTLALMGLVILMSWHSAASAHDWYSSTSDPVYSSNCCGGHDCAPIDPAWVSEVPEGYRLNMTLAQAQTVNPAAQAPVDAIIPWTRVQSPPKADHLFYACIYERDRAEPRRGVICFFATPVM